MGSISYLAKIIGLLGKKMHLFSDFAIHEVQSVCTENSNILISRLDLFVKF